MISIISLAHDRDKNLEFAINCWQQQTFKEFELNIFESANLESTINILKKYKNYFKINCYRLHLKFVDKTKTLNYLVKNSNYDIICVWDVDLIKPPQYLENCLKLLGQNNFVQNCARYVNKGFTQKIFDEKLSFDEIVYWNSRFPKCFNRAESPSQLCLYKKDFLSIGGYDERFFGWGAEDRDFFNRLKRLGKYPVLVEPDCYHLEHSTKNNYTFNVFNSKLKNQSYFKENNDNNICLIDNSNIFRLINQHDESAKIEKIEL